MMEHWSSDSDDQGTPDDADASKAPTPHAGPENGHRMMAKSDSQVGPAQNGQDATVSSQTAAGGAGSSLDMSNERDRGLAREAMKRWPRRWAGIDPELKQAMLDGLKEAAGVARECMATKVDPLVAAKVMTSVVTTVVAMEAQCQKDEHRAEDFERIDNGQATQAVQLYGRDAPIEAV